MSGLKRERERTVLATVFESNENEILKLGKYLLNKDIVFRH
jgi:hypothetical protein